VTEKDSSDGAAGSLAYGSCGMQGWRTNMEDSHLNVLGFDGDDAAAHFIIG